MSAVVYPGKDLEAMSFAKNYHDWILSEFRPFIGHHLVEVGAGTGDFSAYLIREQPKSLALVEPSEMFQHLSEINSETVSITRYNRIFALAVDEIIENQRPDTILYVNVLEHIEHDEAELKLVYDTLSPGGKALIFVPALQQLYGKFDKQIGHFRRYTKREIVEKSRSAGFVVKMAKYFDFVGMFPWFIKYRIFRSASFEPGLVETYDRFAVPINRVLEGKFVPPIGKNLIVVLEKPEN